MATSSPIDMNTLVLQCVMSMKEIVQSIAALQGKVVFVVDQDDLVAQLKGVRSFPAAGIMYEGMRSRENDGQTAKLGISADMVISIVVVNRGSDILNTDQTKLTSITLLDQIRGKVIATRSPTGHFWRFVVEAAAAENEGVVFWVQRWSTPVQVAPTPAR
jgi:hypothetical protein